MSTTLIPSAGVPRRYRGNAIAVGVLFIACTASSILSAAFPGSALDGTDYLTKLAGSPSQAVLTALVEFVWAATGAGVASALTRFSGGTTARWLSALVAGRVGCGPKLLVRR